jgi:hypothetical protein
VRKGGIRPRTFGKERGIGALLGIYLNDHLAGSTLGVELAKRSLRSNRGTEFEGFLERLLQEIVEDRQALERYMAARGVQRSRVKPLFALLGERAGRLKPNGRVTGYSPLSRVVELEGLMLGVSGKLALWRLLRDLDGAGPAAAGVDFGELERRAERQLEELDERRREAGRLALA